jgi:RimJ/RimL family protein N-acetyltransferase
MVEPTGLETERLIVRPCEAGDAGEIYRAQAESLLELQRWFWWCHPLEQAACFDWVRSRPEAWRSGTELAWVIRERSGGRLIGCAWIGALDWQARRGSVGYWIRTSAAGQGYASEAVRALVQFGLHRAGLERIEIVAAVENAGSCRVAEKVGGVYEGTARRRLRIAGAAQDACVYSVVPEDI